MVGRTATLYPKLYPEGSETTFSWETSDRKIATVSGGVVTGVGEGQARITVRTANGKSDYCYVNVYNPQPTGIKINSTNFPDEDFRNWLLKQDYGSDGVLTDAEIAKVTSINVYSRSIQSLKGIEYFTALTSLSCYDNQLTSLDVSKNTALQVLRCYSNNLTSLGVSKNTALERLDCEKNKLTSLDVSKNTALKNLYCYSNQLTSLDVSKNTELELFSCSDNQLASLDLSNNVALITLDCEKNKLTSLDVSKNTRLQIIYCNSNNLTSLDVSKSTALTKLWCYSNRLTSLDVSKNTVLTSLDCRYNHLNSLNVSKNTALTMLNIGDNQLTSLDVSKNTALTGLWCFKNPITMLDVSKNTALTNLSCFSNQLTSLDVSKNTALTKLWCYSNQLTSLDVSKNTVLTTLWCYQNKIKGKAMDTLVESLPTVSSGTIRVIYYENEKNVMTTTQVADAKTKGWTPYYTKDGTNWEEYDGSDPSESEITLKCVSYGNPTYEFIYESAWEDLQEMNPNAIGVVSSKDANWAKSQKNVLVEYINDSKTSYTCPYFELTDLTYGYNVATEVAKTGFYTPVSFKVTKGSYKRLAYAGYNTLCLPFSFKASELSSSAKVFTFDSYDADKTKVVFKSVSGTIAAGTPCIVKEKTNVVWNVNLAGKTIEAALPLEESHMRGTYVTTDHYQGKGYSPRRSDNKFAPLTQYLHPFRACFSVSDLNNVGARGSLSAVFLDEDGATVIDEINAAGGAANDSKTIYTLSGQRINEVKRSGIYIVNGEKQYIEVK